MATIKKRSERNKEKSLVNRSITLDGSLNHLDVLLARKSISRWVYRKEKAKLEEAFFQVKQEKERGIHL